MRWLLRSSVVAGVAAAVFAVLTLSPLTGQTRTPNIPRLANGKPDFNGIWQALNSAN